MPLIVGLAYTPSTGARGARVHVVTERGDFQQEFKIGATVGDLIDWVDSCAHAHHRALDG